MTAEKLSLPKDSGGQAIQVLRAGTSHNLSVGITVVNTPALASRIVRVSSSVNTRIALGTSVLTNTGYRMPGDAVEYFEVSPGQTLAFISEDGVTSGVATVTDMG